MNSATPRDPFAALVQGLGQAGHAVLAAPAKPRRPYKPGKPLGRPAVAREPPPPAPPAAPRAMQHTHALKRLLEHGALNVRELLAITGWRGEVVSSTLQVLCSTGVAQSALIDGRRYYGLRGVFDNPHKGAGPERATQATTTPPPPNQTPAS